VQEYGVKPAGADTLEYTGFAGPMFANLLTVAKFINSIGVDNVSPESMLGAMKSFKGPMMLQAGPLDCGNITVLAIPFPSACASLMGVQQYKDGQWISVADALNGKAIDATTI